MSKVIIINNGDGSCSIIHPAQEMFDLESRTRKVLEHRGITFNSDEEVLNFIQQKDVPQGLSSRITDIENIPTDREFRDAWTDDFATDTVDIDITKAKEIKKESFRLIRKPLLEALDIEYQKADEENNIIKKQQIALKKKELRDVTKLVLPNDLTLLKTYMPDILK